MWGSGFVGSYVLTIRVEALERGGLLKDITTMLSNEKIKVNSMNSRTDYKRQITIMDFHLDVHNVDILNRIVARVEQIKDVLRVKRLK